MSDASALVGSGSLDNGRHLYPVRVYYEDTDAGGIVYHSKYLNYAERARTEMLRCHGIAQSDMRQAEGVVFAVRDCQVAFRRPARFDELLEVRTEVSALAGATISMAQKITRDGEILVTLDFRIAAVNEKGRATRLPQSLRKVFARQREHETRTNFRNG